MAVYPFWSAVTVHIGRQLRLQGTTTVSQVQCRIREQYGERGVVSLSVQKIFLSLADWGVLRRTTKREIYASGLSLVINDIEVVAWLVEAFLHAHQNGPTSLDAILNSPSLFPFRLSPVSADQLTKAFGWLDAFLVGLDQALITLKDCSQ